LSVPQPLPYPRGSQVRITERHGTLTFIAHGVVDFDPGTKKVKVKTEGGRRWVLRESLTLEDGNGNAS
jgi:hypothetical protein